MLDWLSGWYNWPFLFTLAVGVFFIFAQVLLGGLLEAGSDADVDADVDVDADIDADIDADADVSHGGHGALSASLLWLGMGKVPMTIILESMFISFGCCGLLVNALWSEIAPASWLGLSFPFALGGAFFGSLFLTRLFAGAIAKVLPNDSTISRSAGSWVGERAVVVSKVTLGAGQVRVTGRGNVPDAILNVKRAESCTVDLPHGQAVRVVDYLAASNTYTVASMEDKS